MNGIEIRRQNLQKELDEAKDLLERNKLGQFSTPYPLASQICNHLTHLIGDSVDTVLEPAIGTGVFYSAIQDSIKVKKCVGYEIDDYYFTPTASLWSGYNLKIINKDFLVETPTEKFDLIISNPPYSRNHHIPTETKKKLSEKIYRNFGIDVSGLSGLYIYFVILSTMWLKEGGFSCWLIPSEFLTVNYGASLKQFLLNNVDLIRIHSFEAEDVQFSDALVSSSIIIFKKNKPSSNPIEFSWGGSLDTPSAQSLIKREDLDSNSKWNKDLLMHKIDISNDPYSRLGNFFIVKRGISTGDNGFFIINEEIIKEYGISHSFVTPIAPPPRKLKTDILTSDCSKEDNLFLISCDLPLDIIKEKNIGLYHYLNIGIEKEVNLKANCKNRHLWYNCEKREKSPILVSYMGRDNGKSSIRFILNEANATASNSYLMLYPKDEFKHLFKDPTFIRQIWITLKDIPKDILRAYGRVYGGGLIKWEPTELASIPCPALKKMMTSISPSLFD